VNSGARAVSLAALFACVGCASVPGTGHWHGYNKDNRMRVSLDLRTAPSPGPAWLVRVPRVEAEGALAYTYRYVNYEDGYDFVAVREQAKAEDIVASLESGERGMEVCVRNPHGYICMGGEDDATCFRLQFQECATLAPRER
jgi:hypothetical protein